MIKRLFYILLLAVFMVVSCTGSLKEQAAGEPIKIDAGTITGNVSEAVEVMSESQEIQLDGLKGGAYYTIYCSGSVKDEKAGSAWLSAGAQIGSSKAAVPELLYLDNGTYGFAVPEGTESVSFRAGNIGLGAGDTFRVSEKEVRKIVFTPGWNGFEHGQCISEPLFIEDGEEVYEAFISIDVKTIPYADHVAVTEMINHTGNGAGSHSFAFVDEYGKRIDIPNGIVDLSGYDKVYIWTQMRVSHSDNNDMVQHVYFLQPQTLGETQSVLRNPGVYLLPESAVDQYIVVDSIPNDNGGLGVFVNDLNARYADTGKRFRGVYPLGFYNGKLIINVPKHDSDVIFDYDGAEAVPAHIEDNDGRIPVYSMGKGSKTFEVPDGTSVVAIEIEGGIKDPTVSVVSGSGNSLLFCFSSGTSGKGYSKRSIDNSGSVKILDGFLLDALVFRNRSDDPCSFTITIS